MRDEATSYHSQKSARIGGYVVVAVVGDDDDGLDGDGGESNDGDDASFFGSGAVGDDAERWLRSGLAGRLPGAVGL